MRRRHQRLVVDRLRQSRNLSRAELAGYTSLSPPTVGKVADELIKAGLLEEYEPAGHDGEEVPAGRTKSEAATLGRPARPLRLNRTTPRLIALQIGVRHTRLAAIPIAPMPDATWPVSFNTPGRAKTWSARLKQAAGKIKLAKPWAVTLSVPGVIDEQAGRVLLSPNLHWTEKADLVQLIRKVWNVPVIVSQEIRALALGHLAACPAELDFLLVDFGDGVGAALMQRGRLYHGTLPLTGELGHTPIPGNGRPCGCGAIGCIETLVSRPGLLESFNAQRRGKRKRSWRDLNRTIEAGGLPAWLKKTLDATATVVAGAMNLTGVKHVVITGSLTELPPPVVRYLGRAIERASMWARFGTIDITDAPRRRAAGLALTAIDRLLLPLNTSDTQQQEAPMK